MRYIKRTIDHCPMCNSSNVEINNLNDSVTLLCRKCFCYSVIRYPKKRKSRKKREKEIIKEINEYFYDLLAD